MPISGFISQQTRKVNSSKSRSENFHTPHLTKPLSVWAALKIILHHWSSTKQLRDKMDLIQGLGSMGQFPILRKRLRKESRNGKPWRKEPVKKSLDCGNNLKWLFLWDLSCSDIAGCSRGLSVFGSQSCLLENNSWNQRRGWTTGRKKVLNILLANSAEEDNAVQLSWTHKFHWYFQRTAYQCRLRKRVSLYVLSVKKREWSTAWVDWMKGGWRREQSNILGSALKRGKKTDTSW